MNSHIKVYEEVRSDKELSLVNSPRTLLVQVVAVYQEMNSGRIERTWFGGEDVDLARILTRMGFERSHEHAGWVRPIKHFSELQALDELEAELEHEMLLGVECSRCEDNRATHFGDGFELCESCFINQERE